MTQRSQNELEQLAYRLWQENSKTCPDCQQPSLAINFDEHYLKLACGRCQFGYVEYFGN